MAEFNSFIQESVDFIVQDYEQRMADSKKVCFNLLKEKGSADEFKDTISDIWKNTNQDYIKQQENDLQIMIDRANAQGKTITGNGKDYFDLVPQEKYHWAEKKYKDKVETFFERNSEALKKEYVDDEQYLADIVAKYDTDAQAAIPYYSKGKIRCYQTVSTYCGMLTNVSLTHSAWNRTLYDSEYLENDLLYLPAHNLACELCMPWQGYIYSNSGKDKRFRAKEEAIEGGIGHPNCRHCWVLYWGSWQIQSDKFDTENDKEAYNRAEKARAIKLQIRRSETDSEIYHDLGAEGKADKTDAKIQALYTELKKIGG